MSRYLNYFLEETIIKVLRAYLIDGDSHRSIQKNILGLPAPTRGGGFIVMDILHHFDIKGEQKGVLSNQDNYETDSEMLSLAIKKIKEFNKLEEIAKNAIESNSITEFEIAAITEVDAKTKQRIGQSALRKVVLNNYSNRCALCDIHHNDLLICSNIVPWTIDEANRLNPSNAISLCSLHDSLFDKGYFSLDDNFNILLSAKSDTVISGLLKDCNFAHPDKQNPGTNFLKYHREEICEILK